jgi:uncharacterized membrane protein YoaK (UPF0700 family)
MSYVLRCLIIVTILWTASGFAYAATAPHGEAGRGFPYSSSESWSWGPFLFIIFLFLVLGVAAAVIEELKSHHWSQAVVVAVITLLSALALAERFEMGRDVGGIIFALIPCVFVIGILYLLTAALVKKWKNKA